MKRMFKYLILFILAYIIINISSYLLIKSTNVKLNDRISISEISSEELEQTAKEPFVWFIALGALVVLLP